jgi:hypothetical protein
MRCRPATRREVVAEFSDIPADEIYPERLRVAAAFVPQLQIAVLIRLAASRLEELNKHARSKTDSAAIAAADRHPGGVRRRD